MRTGGRRAHKTFDLRKTRERAQTPQHALDLHSRGQINCPTSCLRQFFLSPFLISRFIAYMPIPNAIFILKHDAGSLVSENKTKKKQYSCWNYASGPVTIYMLVSHRLR